MQHQVQLFFLINKNNCICIFLLNDVLQIIIYLTVLSKLQRKTS